MRKEKVFYESIEIVVIIVGYKKEREFFGRGGNYLNDKDEQNLDKEYQRGRERRKERVEGNDIEVKVGKVVINLCGNQYI